MGVDDEYRAIALNEDSADHLEKSAPITRAYYKKRSVWASLVAGALIGAAATLLVSLFFTPHTTLTSPPTTTSVSQQPNDKTTPTSPTAPFTPPTEALNDTILDCGTNAAEARSKGCIFDVMMQLWMPPACYDSHLSERYLATGNWTWWADDAATHSLSLDEMRRGEHDVIFVVQDYHRQHCIFAWEKAVRALRNDAFLVEELISYDHVMHCKMRTLGPDEPNVRGVRAPTGFARCAKYDTWIRHLPANKMSSVD